MEEEESSQKDRGPKCKVGDLTHNRPAMDGQMNAEVYYRHAATRRRQHWTGEARKTYANQCPVSSCVGERYLANDTDPI